MVRVILYNIEYFEGTKSFAGYFNVLKMFRSCEKIEEGLIPYLRELKPDILALLEFDNGSRKTKHRDEKSYFQNKLDLPHRVGAARYARKGIWKIYRKAPIMRFLQNTLMTNFNIDHVRYHYLKNGVKRLLIQADLEVPQKISIFVAHLALGYKTRKKQLEEIATIINNSQYPVILMGDFNAFKGEEELATLKEQTKLKDARKLSRSKDKNTHPAWNPKRQLDYVLVSKEIKILEYKIEKVNYSDHLPVIFDFEVIE